MIPLSDDNRNPLAESNRLLADIGSLRQEIARCEESGLVQYEQLRSLLAQAWRERQSMIDSWFDLLGSVASLCDDLARESEPLSPDWLESRLAGLLNGCNVELVTPAVGTIFDPEHHDCAGTTRMTDQPDDLIASVVSREIVLRKPGAESVTVRPASVIVSKRVTECETEGAAA